MGDGRANLLLMPRIFFLSLGIFISLSTALINSAPVSEDSANAMIEDCFNLTDDDGDGAIDAFDEDCVCQSEGPNLVPNSSFDITMGCCADLSERNCLEDWVVTGPSPDYVSDNCPNANLRPDVRFLTDAFNTSFNEGYVFSIVSQAGNQSFAESLGICLEELMTKDKTYFFSFDVTEIRNMHEDVDIAFYGISRCDSLSHIDSNCSWM